MALVGQLAIARRALGSGHEAAREVVWLVRGARGGDRHVRVGLVPVAVGREAGERHGGVISRVRTLGAVGGAVVNLQQAGALRRRLSPARPREVLQEPRAVPGGDDPRWLGLHLLRIAGGADTGRERADLDQTERHAGGALAGGGRAARRAPRRRALRRRAGGR